MKLRTAALAGFRFQAYLKLFSVASHQIGSLVLAVLLTPRDFAVVGLATVFVGFSSGIADFGLGSAVIQHRDDFRMALQTGATLRLLLSIAAMVAVALTAPFISNWYNTVELTGVMWALSFLLFLQFAGFASRVSLTKLLRFKQAFIPEVAGGAATSFSCIGLALVGWSYWSLVAGSLIGAAVNVIGLYLLSPWRIVWVLNRNMATKLVRFGAPLVIAGVLASLFGSFGVVVLGAINLADVGYYLFAYTWAVSVPMGIHTSIDNVMFPIYSAMEMDKDRIRAAYLRTSGELARLIIPLDVFFIAAAPSFILALVGSKWANSIPMLQLLGAVGFVLVLSSTYHSFAVSLGHPREITLYNVLGLVVSVPLTLALAPPLRGVGVALSLLIAEAFLLCWATWRTEVILHGTTRRLSVLYAVPAVASAGSGASVWVVAGLLPVSLPTLLLEVCVGAAMYCAAMQALTRGRFIAQTRELMLSFFG